MNTRFELFGLFLTLFSVSVFGAVIFTLLGCMLLSVVNLVILLICASVMIIIVLTEPSGGWGEL